jgi:hypothetical protein
LVFVVIFPFSFLISLIWVFYLLFLVRFGRGLSKLLIILKNQLLLTLWFFFWSLLYWFPFLLFIIFLLLVVLSFSRSLRCSIRLFIWDLSVFLM